MMGKGSTSPYPNRTRKPIQESGVKTKSFLVPGLQGSLVANLSSLQCVFQGGSSHGVEASADRERHGGFVGIHGLGPRKDFHLFWAFSFNFYQDDVNGGWTTGQKTRVFFIVVFRNFLLEFLFTVDLQCCVGFRCTAK